MRPRVRTSAHAHAVRTRSVCTSTCTTPLTHPQVDSHLEEHVIAPAAKHAEALARASLRASLTKVDPLFARLWRHGSEGLEQDTMERSANPPQMGGAL